MLTHGVEWWRLVLLIAWLWLALVLLRAVRRKTIQWQLGSDLLTADRRREPKTYWGIIVFYAGWLAFLGFILVATWNRNE
jgi:hypothetical protein